MRIPPSLFQRAKAIASRGDRTPEEDALLEEALKSYIVGRSKPEEGAPTHCSLLVTEIQGLSKTGKAYLHSHGVKYVGEMYFIAAAGGHRKPRACFKDVERLLNIPTNYSPLANGWRPPYWDDERVLTALRLDPEQFIPFKDYGEWYPNDGDPAPKTMREYIVRVRRNPCREHDGLTAFDPERLRYLDIILRRVTRAFHAAMVMPPEKG